MKYPYVILASFTLSLSVFTACGPTNNVVTAAGECNPGTLRCNVNGVVQFCDCDSQGGNLYAGCRVPPRWVASYEQCLDGETCVDAFSTDGATCMDSYELEACTNFEDDKTCLDDGHIEGCFEFEGIGNMSSQEGIFGVKKCREGAVCSDYYGETACVIPPEGGFPESNDVTQN